MLQFLPAVLRGAITLFLLAVYTFLLALMIFCFGLLRLLPIVKLRKTLDHFLHSIPEYWTAFLKLLLRLFIKTDWQVHGLKKLDPEGHYVMVANHRSWLDILVLQKIFSRKIPGLRFFMKKELMWQLPIIGFACKLLGFPLMQRYSREFLKKNPHLKGKDIEATRKICERFRENPVTLINFIEGGRFTKEKHRKQKSPYKNLLKPKAGGLAFVLASMSDQLDAIIDVTIIYPHQDISFWDFLCGKTESVQVYIHTQPIKEELLGDYQNDERFQKFFQDWLNEQWAKKDKFITDRLCLNESKTNPPT